MAYMEWLQLIGWPLLLTVVSGLLIGVLLSVFAKAFEVKKDPKIEQVREQLPGINCGACGFSGCDVYAEKAALGEAPVGLCVPGADSVSLAMSKILGVEYVDVAEQVALVHCQGCSSHVTQRYEFHGVPSCRGAMALYGGDKSCRFGCLGYGDCADVCEFGAITILDRLAKVNPDLCTGCGACAKACPMKVIGIVPQTKRAAVLCTNHDKGKIAMAVCKTSCIACKKCERTCTHQAITVVDNCACVIAENCVGCGDCVAACPKNCIVLLHNRISGNLMEQTHSVEK